MEPNKLADLLGAQVTSHPSGVEQALVHSVWDWECYDKHGNLKWKDQTHNTVQKEGLTSLLNVGFHGGTQITQWYCALFESDTAMTAGTATYAAPVYTECTAYDEATRPVYNEGAAGTAGTISISNVDNKAEFTISDTKTVYGGALVGGGTAGTTKADTAGGGVLYCASKFATSKNVVDDDVIKLTVTLVGAAG